MGEVVGLFKHGIMKSPSRFEVGCLYSFFCMFKLSDGLHSKNNVNVMSHALLCFNSFQSNVPRYFSLLLYNGIFLMLLILLYI